MKSHFADISVRVRVHAADPSGLALTHLCLELPMKIKVVRVQLFGLTVHLIDLRMNEEPMERELENIVVVRLVPAHSGDSTEAEYLHQTGSALMIDEGGGQRCERRYKKGCKERCATGTALQLTLSQDEVGERGSVPSANPPANRSGSWPVVLFPLCNTSTISLSKIYMTQRVACFCITARCEAARGGKFFLVTKRLQSKHTKQDGISHNHNIGPKRPPLIYQCYASQ